MFKFSKQKHKELLAELEYRKNAFSLKIKNDLIYASELGDYYRENFPFTEALEKHESNQYRILELEKILKNAKIVEDDGSKTIQIGSKVVLQKLDATLKTVILVEDLEVNPSENKISINSPLGKSLIGKKVGDKVSVTLPYGQEELTVLKAE